MKPVLELPVKNFVITQPYGVRNTMYDRFGFLLHNGVDFLLAPDAKVHAPHEGLVSVLAYQPTGAGHYIGILSQYPYEFEDGNYYMFSEFMHLDHALLKVGDKVQPGDVLAIADNTGYSTGPHTHWAFQRYSFDGSKYVNVDHNDANNTVDPMPFVQNAPPNPSAPPDRTTIQKALIVALTSLKGLLERLVAQKKQ